MNIGVSSDKGNRRFRLMQPLGSGAYGEVYLAEDTERGGLVALKNLRRAEPTALAQFKQEFRALADIVHPNLAQLYELFAEEDRWYFTMEFIDGPPFLDYLWGDGAPGAPRTTASGSDPQKSGPAPREASTYMPAVRQDVLDIDKSTFDGEATQAPSAMSGRLARALESEEGAAFPSESQPAGEFGSGFGSSLLMSAAPEPPSDPVITNVPAAADTLDSLLDGPIIDDLFLERLRSGFLQIVRGVQALHAARQLHRDLKPSNVLTTQDGRVVILDFGLVVELERVAKAARRMTGTPAYMSPEQAAREELEEASDWYAVGVMLYQALTGRLPFEGTLQQVVALKTVTEAPPVMERAPDAPPELAELCARLLLRDPKARADGAEILKVFGETQAPRKSSPAAAFVGREDELEELRGAFEDVRGGEAVVAAVSGRSGMGKSALIERFLEDVDGIEEALVLRGRCYQQESVPYKVWDPLIDALARALSGVPDETMVELVPDELPALTRLFPSLRQVRSFAAVEPSDIPDPQEVQRRAFVGLKSLLSRLSQRVALVLYADDLQWGDLDSIQLLERVLSPPRPALLFLVSFREEDRSSSPVLERFLEMEAPRRHIELAGFTTRELALLHRLYLGSRGFGAAKKSELEDLARDSGGSPYFAGELLRTIAELGESEAREGLVLDDLLIERVRALAELPRALLEVTAVAGRPLLLGVAGRLFDDGLQGAVGALRSSHFIRADETGARARIVTYHDRIRESVVASLEPERLRELHRKLAQAMRSEGGEDPEVLVVHFRAAGETDDALRYALQAAERAYEALSFDNAARLYRLAIELGEDGVDLRIRLGESLTNARRYLEAAREYLGAAERVDAERAIDLQARAANHYFTSGHIDEGMETTRRLLEVVGMRLPDYNLLDKLKVLARGVMHRLRPIRYTIRPESEVPRELLRRIDACWSVTSSMNAIDVVACIDFNHRMVKLALEAGEPVRLARALSANAYLCVNFFRVGRRAQIRRSQWLMDQSTRLVEDAGSAYGEGLVCMMSAVAAYARGHFRRGRDHGERSITSLRERCTGVAFSLDSVYAIRFWCLIFLGEARVLAAELPQLIEEYEERNNLYALMMVGGINLNWHYLFSDQVEEGEVVVTSSLERAKAGVGRDAGFHVWSLFITQADRALYRGDAAGAWSIIEDQWSDLVSNQVLEIQMARIMCLDCYGRGALALAATLPRGQRGPWLRKVRKAAKKLAREPAAHGEPLAVLLQVQADFLEDEGDPLTPLIRAERRFDEADMPLHTMVCRWHRGQRMTQEGEARVLEAEAWFASNAIQNPERLSALLAPGFVKHKA